MANFGVSFVPGQNGDQMERPGPGGAQPTPVQEAIRILSLRLPRFFSGGSPIAPMPLLQSPGGAALGPESLGTLFGQPHLLPTPGGLPPIPGPVSPPQADLPASPRTPNFDFLTRGGVTGKGPRRMPRLPSRASASRPPTPRVRPITRGGGQAPQMPTPGGPPSLPPVPPMAPLPDQPMGWGNAPDVYRGGPHGPFSIDLDPFGGGWF